MSLPNILMPVSRLPAGESSFLHQNGFRHGDIRRDHIFVDRDTGLYYWIDFDYDFYLPEKPYALDLYELGNILIYLVGRGDYHPREILADPGSWRTGWCELTGPRRLFPAGPEPGGEPAETLPLHSLIRLNNILLHFSARRRYLLRDRRGDAGRPRDRPQPLGTVIARLHIPARTLIKVSINLHQDAILCGLTIEIRRLNARR